MKALLLSLVLLPILAVADDFRFVGYLPEYRARNISNSWTEQLTDLIVFSIAPEENGDIKASDRLLALIPKLPRKNLRLHICVGGWGKSANFAVVAADSAKRRRFAKVLLEFCQTHKLQGIDIDWEFPRGPEQIANFAALLRELRKTLDPAGLLLTAAIAEHQTFGPEIYSLCHYWHLMSYDHQSPPTIAMTVDDINTQRLAGMPRERLIVGIPFYGRRSGDRESVTFAEITRQYAPEPHVDSVGGIDFNNVDTVRRKTRIAHARGLAGVMFWEIGQDTTDHRLLRAANSAIPD